MAEAEDLKSSQCGFDPHSGHVIRASICSFAPFYGHSELCSNIKFLKLAH